jgi:hypothetical protein
MAQEACPLISPTSRALQERTLLTQYAPQEEAERCFRLARSACNEQLVVELESLGWAFLFEAVEGVWGGPEGWMQAH